jgi:hypothetical protein
MVMTMMSNDNDSDDDNGDDDKGDDEGDESSGDDESDTANDDDDDSDPPSATLHFLGMLWKGLTTMASTTAFEHRRHPRINGDLLTEILQKERLFYQWLKIEQHSLKP